MTRSLAPGRPIGLDELSSFLNEAFANFGDTRERLLVIVPDDTRTLPMPTIFETLCTVLTPRVMELAFLIALGTHPPMTEEELDQHLGSGWRTRSGVRVVQHAWQDPQVLVHVGSIPARELEEISGGLLSEDVSVTVNRLAVEFDRILIVNPVFPHEVVGFSGGHKYLFPGISGSEILDVSHWLGALITNPKVNGHKETPVRALIERASDRIPTPRIDLSLVMSGHDVVGLFAGEVPRAWSDAADLSARVNIVWKDRAYDTVISAAPGMYRELWTAGKCMYKLEPVVADGGRLVIYAPHIDQISPTHGRWIEHVGYHTRDYFLADMERFRDIPRAVLAHSTHVKGIGTIQDGVEHPRVDVVLATALPESVCSTINLGYADPAAIDIGQFEGREQEGILVVPNAGEMLYRLADGSVPDIDRLQ